METLTNVGTQAKQVEESLNKEKKDRGFEILVQTFGLLDPEDSDKEEKEELPREQKPVPGQELQQYLTPTPKLRRLSSAQDRVKPLILGVKLTLTRRFAEARIRAKQRWRPWCETRSLARLPHSKKATFTSPRCHKTRSYTRPKS
jgi:hypothetical protein